MGPEHKLFAMIVVATLLAILGSSFVYEWGEVERAACAAPMPRAEVRREQDQDGPL